MNATYVLMTNFVDDEAENDAALALCAKYGLKGIATDYRLTSQSVPLDQTVGGAGSFVSKNHPLGQTYRTPWGVYPGTRLIQLNIYPASWSPDVPSLSVFIPPRIKVLNWQVHHVLFRQSAKCRKYG